MNERVLLVTFDVKPDCLGQFKRLLEDDAQAATADEPGCLQFDILSAPDNPSRIVSYEVYRNEDALQAHLGTPQTRIFLAAFKALITGQTVVRLNRDCTHPGNP